MSVSAYEQALSQLIRCICVLSKNINLPERFLYTKRKIEGDPVYKVGKKIVKKFVEKIVDIGICIC